MMLSCVVERRGNLGVLPPSRFLLKKEKGGGGGSVGGDDDNGVVEASTRIVP